MQGLKQARRQSHERPISDPCQFYFLIGYHHKGYHIIATGGILSHQNITYLCQKLKQDTPEHNQLLLDSLSSVDQMIEDFKKKNDYDY